MYLINDKVKYYAEIIVSTVRKGDQSCYFHWSVILLSYPSFVIIDS